MAQSFTNFKKGYTSSYPIWAATATTRDSKTPGDTKIKQGWVIEKPSHATMNFWQKRTDTRLEELEAKVAWLVSELGYTL